MLSFEVDQRLGCWEYTKLQSELIMRVCGINRTMRGSVKDEQGCFHTWESCEFLDKRGVEVECRTFHCRTINVLMLKYYIFMENLEIFVLRFVKIYYDMLT